MTPSQTRALRFVADHPGGTADRAWLGGYKFRFDAPELKRAPFRVTTLYGLLHERLIAIRGGKVVVTERGRKALEAGR